MENTFARVRYWLEIIALPAFVLLVIHLAGHGIMSLIEGRNHTHENHSEGFEFADIFDNEVVAGIFILILFVWIWHRPGFKKWVPCRHDHCHGEKKMPHMLAITAFCLHFFPESSVRHALIDQAMAGEISSLIGVVAFGAHFLLDVLVAVMLSMYWDTRNKRIMSLFFIVGIWFVAFFFGKNFSVEIAASAKGGMFLLSAFLLSMFIHRPHKPKKSCSGCCEY